MDSTSPVYSKGGERGGGTRKSTEGGSLELGALIEQKKEKKKKKKKKRKKKKNNSKNGAEEEHGRKDDHELLQDKSNRFRSTPDGLNPAV